MRDVMTSVIEQLDQTQAGDPWYGTSRTALLAGISARDAAAHPIATGHSIWELVLHMTAWTHEATRRLNGAKPGAPAEGDWPAVAAVTDEAWQQAQDALARAHAELVAAARALPAPQWQQPARELRDAALGTGVDRTGLIVGLAQHDAYHIGQLAVVRQALGKSRTITG